MKKQRVRFTIELDMETTGEGSLMAALMPANTVNVMANFREALALKLRASTQGMVDITDQRLKLKVRR